MRIALVPNREKADALAAAAELRDLLTPVADAVIATDSSAETLASLKPDLLVVLGGDGSLLAVAQAMAEIDVPVVGVNFGKLGYLAAYSIDDFRRHLPQILAGNAPMTERLMLQAGIYLCGFDRATSQNVSEMLKQKPIAHAVALNDVVINAGDPFRVVELEVQINGARTTTFRSDGVIVSTSSGSTGYNLSAGGPLITPDVHAMVLTPICPHSLSFRPVVLADSAHVVIVPHHLNAGSKVNFDGQTTFPLREGECLLIRRWPKPLKLIENPEISHWQMLGAKLQWARSPSQK